MKSPGDLLDDHLYRAIVDRAPVMLWLAGADGHRSFFNRSWLEFTGRRAEDAAGMGWLDSVHPEDRGRLQRAVTRGGEAVEDKRLLYRLRDRAGDYHWVLDLGVPLADGADAPAGTLGAVIDVTQRRRAERLRRRSEDRLRTAFHHAPIGMALCTPDGTFEELNRSFTGMLGYDPDDLIGTSFLGITHPDDRETSRHAVMEGLRGHSPRIRMQKRYLRQDGSIVWAQVTATLVRDPDGRPQSWIVQVQDVTEHLEAMHLLKRHKERFEEAQRIAHLGNWEWHLPSGRFAWSDELFRILGVTPKETQPSLAAFLERVHPDDRERIHAGLDVALAERGTYVVEHRIVTVDGAVRWVQGEGRVERDFDGTPLRMAGTVQDVTDRKEAELALRTSEAQLHEAQKFESVRRLAGGIAHDFNNLLLVITGHAGLLEGRCPDDEPALREVRAITGAASRAARLTRQLLAFSRRQVLQPRVLDLNAVVDDVEKALQRMIGEDIELITAFGEDVGTVRADPGQLEQVLLNLAVNARDAMPAGGRLTIETHNEVVTASEQEDRDGLKPGHYIVLSMMDTGCGMPNDVQEQVFDPFFTTKERGKGTGLGLSTVHGIVTQSGGSIAVRSRPGVGTCFTVRLPRCDAPVEELRAEVVHREDVRGTETLLVVEDDELILDLMTRILQDQGYKVLGAGHGEEALRILRSYGDPIHLLVTDVVMPGMGGPELVRRARALRLDVRVLYVTGYVDRPELIEGEVDGEEALLRKPFAPSDLTRRVRERLETP